MQALKIKEAVNFEEKESILIRSENEDINDDMLDDLGNESGSDEGPVEQKLKQFDGSNSKSLQSQSFQNQVIRPRQLFQSKNKPQTIKSGGNLKNKRPSNSQNHQNVINSTSQIQTTKYFNQNSGHGNDLYRMKNIQLKLKTPETTNQQNSRKSIAALDSSRGRNALRAKNGGGSKKTVDKTSSVGKTQMMRIPSTN